MSKGKWFQLQIPISQIVSNGIPEVGDMVILEYKEDSTPSTGSARYFKAANHKSPDMYKSKETGMDIILTGEFLT